MEQTTLSVLSNTVRLHIIGCLSRKRQNVTQLVKNCDLSQSAVSQHLEKLRAAGIVATERDGKEVYYSLVSPQAARVSRELLRFTRSKK